MRKLKIIILLLLLILKPALLNEVEIPKSLDLYEIYVFLFEVFKYWREDIERLIDIIITSGIS